MTNKLDVREMIKTGVILFLITAISAALLAIVNAKTTPFIEKNSAEKEQRALAAVMPSAKSFEETAVPSELESDERGSVNKVYKAYDENRGIVGVCSITETTGYDKGIQTVIGVDMNFKVTGVEITSMNETPGLGAKAADGDFCTQYVGKGEGIGVSKTAADDENVQAISGATKTSVGVTNGVNMAIDAAKYVSEEGGDM